VNGYAKLALFVEITKLLNLIQFLLCVCLMHIALCICNFALTVDSRHKEEQKVTDIGEFTHLHEEL